MRNTDQHSGAVGQGRLTATNNRRYCNNHLTGTTLRFDISAFLVHSPDLARSLVQRNPQNTNNQNACNKTKKHLMNTQFDNFKTYRSIISYHPPHPHPQIPLNLTWAVFTHRFFSPPTGYIHQGHLHKGFPQRETAIMIAGGLGSPQKKYLCLYLGISYLIVHSYLH